MSSTKAFIYPLPQLAFCPSHMPLYPCVTTDRWIETSAFWSTRDDG